MSTILCFASGYEAPPTSKHHVMHVLAEQGNVVLWVNYHASRTPSASGADLRHIARKLGQVAGGLKNPRENVYVLTPLVVPLPGSRLVRRLNRALLVGQIRRGLRKVLAGRPGPLEIWSFTPDVAYLLDRFDQPQVVYYCVDEHSQFTGYDAAQVLRDEEALCRRADLVVTTSGPLYESRKAWNPNTILVPHGVDYDHFARALADDLPAPADLSAIPRPRLGFFGLLRDWVDLDLLAEVARRRPDWHIVLLGDSTVDLAAYGPIANMHFLGPKPYADLPAYCRGFDVGLIPFKLNALTRAVNPIKLREYLAAGLPVVSTPLPEVERYGAEKGPECRVGGPGESQDRTFPTCETQPCKGPSRQAVPSRVHPRGEPAVSEEEHGSAFPASNSQLPTSASGPEGAAQERLPTPFPPASECRVGGPGESQDRTFPTCETQPCKGASQQAVPSRVHPRGEPAVSEEEHGSASPASDSQLPTSASGPEGAAQERLPTPFPPASECRVGGSGGSQDRTFPTCETQPCKGPSRQAVPSRVHPRGEPAVSEEEHGSASPASNSQLPTSASGPEGAAQERLPTPFPLALAAGPDAFVTAVECALTTPGDPAARSAAMRSETWQEKVARIRDELERCQVLGVRCQEEGVGES